MDAATAGLNAQLENASADLQLVAHRLEAQFNARDVPEAHNPLELQARIDRLRARVPGLQADCATIAAKKHELSESTTKMVANRQAIALLQRRSGTRIPAELPLAQA